MVSRSKYIHLFFAILFTWLLFTPIVVHAGDFIDKGYNGSSDDVNGGEQVSVTHAWSDRFKGYRISVVSENDKLVDQTFDMWFGEGTADEVQKILSEAGSQGAMYSEYYRESRASMYTGKNNGIPCEQFLNASGTNEMPPPWLSLTGNGDSLKNWVYSTEEGQEYTNGLRIIEELWGQEAIDLYIQGEEEYFIVIEGLSMFDVLDENNDVIGVFAGTIYNWADICQATHQPYGNVMLRRGTNGTFGVALKLSETWEEDEQKGDKINMTVPPDSIKVGGNATPETNWLCVRDIQAYGYDVHQYTFSSVMNLSTHTWDYSLSDTPGPAPEVEEIKRNKVNIVKVYCTKDKESEEVISWDGSYIRRENPVTIQIEDEPEYIVEEWKTTKEKVYSAPSTWDPILFIL